MAIENGAQATIPLLQPFFSTITTVMNQIKLWVGGLFGLYVIFFVYRIYARRQEMRLFRKMNDNLASLHARLDAANIPRIPTVQKMGLRRRLQRHLRRTKKN